MTINFSSTFNSFTLQLINGITPKHSVLTVWKCQDSQKLTDVYEL